MNDYGWCGRDHVGWVGLRQRALCDGEGREVVMEDALPGARATSGGKVFLCSAVAHEGPTRML